ncbi:MAG: thioredoxin family protein [Chitinophagales bacterium]|nr:thioredoxin family protein [Chitinophagales bacterium]MDW8274379.1 thioredoxin family protein [Chitinophagales bacterium]
MRILIIVLIISANFCFSQNADSGSLRYFEGTYNALKKEAQRLKQPYILLFGASWCAPCKVLKNEVLSQPQIVHFTNSHYLIKYVDLESFEGLEINNEQKVFQLPTMRFFNQYGKKVEDVVGLIDENLMYKKLRINCGIPIGRVYLPSDNDTIIEE